MSSELKSILYGVAIFVVFVVGYYVVSAVGSYHSNAYAAEVVTQENKGLRATLQQAAKENKVLQDALKGCIVQMYRSSDEDLKVYLEKNLGVRVTDKQLKDAAEQKAKQEDLEYRLPKGVGIRK